MTKLNNLFKIILVITISITFSACSIVPGVPGLKSDSSRYAKEQKEGVDYKLVIIDAKAIQNQKPFNYAAYINEKKQRSNAYAARIKSSISDISNKRYSSGTSPKINATSINPASFPGTTADDMKSNYQYKIGNSDILSITIWDHPELTAPNGENGFAGHMVGNDGKFYFPYAGKIQAQGKTANQVRRELESKLQSFITKPQVSVSLANFRSQKVYTSGAVVTPSTLMVNDSPMTVRDAISKSGGVKPFEYTGYATLARNNQNISIDLNRMLKYNDNRQNFILRNGDRLNIIERDEAEKAEILDPIKLRFEMDKERSIARLKKELERELKSEQAKVFVMGEVLKPGSVKYQVEEGMTLAEAINDAGSFKEETVNPKGTFVIRKESESDKIPTVYQLPLASVQSMFFAEQFTVRPRDIIYVTAAPATRWNRILNQMLPALTVYGIATR